MLCSSADDSETKVKVAIKRLIKPLQTAIHAKRTFREIRLLRFLHHDNVNISPPTVLNFINKFILIKVLFNVILINVKI